MQFSGISAKTVNCQRKITCCIFYTSSENPNLLQFKNVYPVVKLPSACFQRPSLANRVPASGGTVVGVVRPSNINTVRQMSDQQAEEYTPAPGCRVWWRDALGRVPSPVQIIITHVEHVYSYSNTRQCLQPLSWQHHPSQLYAGDVMVLPVSKRWANLLICCLVWFSGADVMGSRTSFHHLLTAQPHTWSGRVQGTPSYRKPKKVHWGSMVLT